jgi:sugar lactone lactonase YvrE
MRWSILVGVVVLLSTLMSPSPVCADQVLYVAQQPSPGDTTQVAITELDASGPVGTLATINAPPYSTGTDVNFMVFDQAGNLFANDYFGETIKKITPDGTVSTFSSIGTPMGGLTFDSNGNLYGARSNDDILKFAANGSFSVYASFLPPDGIPNGPAGLAFDKAGNLFVALRGANSILEVKPDGTSSVFATGLSAPFSLAFNSAGDLFVADQGRGIMKVTPDGTISTVATIPGFYPGSLVFGQDGNLYTADYDSILKFTPDGTVSTFDTGLNTPAGLAVQSIPEPSSLLMCCIGGLLALSCAWRNARPRG